MAFWSRKQKTQEKALQSVDDRGWTRIFDWVPGAWQSHTPYSPTADSVLAYPAVFACVSLIQSDIGKLHPTVEKESTDGIWERQTNHPAAELLRRPNNYQNHIQFKEYWLNSKLIHGNSYGFKLRDLRGKVTAVMILDPLKVLPLIADNGDVYYQLTNDRLSKIDPLDENQLVVPATEIIHDRWNCIFHPLIGMSPIFASGSAATMGLSIQKNSKGFFANGSNPSGILSAPGAISDETARRLKEAWESKYRGSGSGGLAVVGDGLKYEPMRMSNVDAQLIEHFKWTAEVVCSTFHVPSYLAGVGTEPAGKNDALMLRYYSQCLQSPIEAFEECFAVGLDLPAGYRVQLDLDGLFRMDQGALVETLTKGVRGSLYTPNDGRKKANLKPLPGGDTVYMQHQDYSLESLAWRDAQPNPFDVANPVPVASAEAVPIVSADGSVDGEEAREKNPLNGDQVQALQGVIEGVAAGSLDPDVAAQLIKVAFPQVSDEEIEAMVGPYRGKQNEPVADDQAEPETDDDPAQDENDAEPEEDLEQAKKYFAYLFKQELVREIK